MLPLLRSSLPFICGLVLSAAVPNPVFAADAVDDNQATVDYWTRETARLAAMPMGLWTRIDEHTIKFDGPIGKVVGGKTDLDRLNDVLRPGDDTYIVSSGGGVVDAGLAVGQRLAPLNMTVIVDGMCFSSCANYLFTAAQKKIIRFGYVGFHGNLTALLAQNWDETATEMAKSGMSPTEIEQAHAAWTATSQIEQTYLKERGISQEMFDAAQRPGKGSPDGKSYFGMLPGPETFARYGIQQVIGQQDANVCRMHSAGSADNWFYCPN